MVVIEAEGSVKPPLQVSCCADRWRELLLKGQTQLQFESPHTVSIPMEHFSWNKISVSTSRNLDRPIDRPRDFGTDGSPSLLEPSPLPPSSNFRSDLACAAS